MNTLGQQRHLQIIATYNEGHSSPETARRCGCGSATVLRVLRRYGVSPRTIAASLRRYTLTEEFFRNIKTEKPAYWLGFIAADGNLSQDGRTLTIGLSITDKPHLVKCAASLCWNGPITIIQRDTGDVCKIAVSSTALVTDLVTTGLTPAKSITCQPWDGPYHLMHHYWRGVFDGDGSVTLRPGRRGRVWGFDISGSRDIVEAFEEFVENRLGFTLAVHRHGRIWRTRTGSLDQVQAILRLLYYKANVYLERKRIISNTILGLTREHRDWSNLTAPALLLLYEQCGSWNKVAQQLNVHSSWLYEIRYRLGMEIQQPHWGKKRLPL